MTTTNESNDATPHETHRCRRSVRARLRAAFAAHERAWAVLAAYEQPWLGPVDQPSSSRATTRTTSASCLVERRSG